MLLLIQKLVQIKDDRLFLLPYWPPALESCSQFPLEVVQGKEPESDAVVIITVHLGGLVLLNFHVCIHETAVVVLSGWVSVETDQHLEVELGLIPHKIQL